MTHLIKKDLFRVFIYVLPVFVIIVFFFLIQGDELAHKSPFFWIFYMFILVSGALATIEKNEEKQRGYHFLELLPVSDREIVAGKFILLLMVVLVLMAANLILSFTSLVPPDFRSIIRMAMVVFGWFYLMSIGVIYVAIYKMGFSRAMTLIWLTVVGGVVGLVFLLSAVLKITGIKIFAIIKAAMDLHPVLWVLIIIFSLGMYIALMEAAVRIKTRSRLDQVF